MSFLSTKPKLISANENVNTPINEFQMVDGTMTFTVDNGRGPITAIFKPNDRFNFCDGKWHEIHAVKVWIIHSYIPKTYMNCN